MGEKDRPKPESAAPPGGSARAARLAEALRANLRRRKEQGRARDADEVDVEACGRGGKAPDEADL